MIDETDILPADQAGGMIQRQHEAGAMDIQVATAQKIGRNLADFKTQLERYACSDQEIADECSFYIKKGGKPIIGPSVRFAELVMATYRHVVADVFVEETARSYVIAGAMARDLYQNTGVRMRVRRSLLKRDGSRVQEDQVTTTVQAAQSIALRNAIMRLVPKALWLPIFRKSREVALNNAMPHEEAVDRAITAFAPLGITEATIVTYFEVGSRVEITPDNLVQLRQKIRAIRAGEVDPSRAFPAPAPDAGSAEEKNADAIERIKQATAPRSEPASQEPPKEAPAPAAKDDPFAEENDGDVGVEL